MSRAYIGSEVFESHCDLIDVTSNSRPDTSWKHVDTNGHVHQWHVNGRPATDYNPQAKYDTPTLVWVKDGIRYYPDGEPYEIGHYECAECRERVGSPRCCPDTVVQYMAGIRRYSINGEPVEEAVFSRRLEEATKA